MGFYIGVKFDSNSKFYNFSVETNELKIGDKVVVETIRGVELGEVATNAMPLEAYVSDLELKPIIRVATMQDLVSYESNKKLAEKSRKIVLEKIAMLGLDMKFVDCEYTLDASKFIFSYVADERVDFRELVKILASELHCRIELRQIRPRDKAKLFGGVGVCGLPICCSVFLDEFEGVSINRAKNQMLAINIPKLSGQCGKLMCCLKFEDDLYTEIKSEMPAIGYKFKYKDQLYTVASINVISKMCKCTSEDGEIYLSSNEIKSNNRSK